MEHVRKNGTAFEVVCDNGDVLPAVEQRDEGWAPCPYRCTLETHVHGVDDAPLTHRVAHCGEDRREKSKKGYFLLRPWDGLLMPFKWWDRAKPVDALTGAGNMGLATASMNGVPGLPGEVA